MSVTCDPPEDGPKHLNPDAARMLRASNAARFSFIERDRVILTPSLRQVQGRLEELYAHARILRPPNLLLFSVSGMGKTHAVTDFSLRRKRRRCRTSGMLKVPVLLLEYPAMANSRWLASGILKELGYSTPLPHYNQGLYELVLDRLDKAGTRLIIIEEVTQLFRWGNEHIREFYGVLRWLSNQSKIPIVLSGTEEAVDLLEGDIQLVRRFGQMELKPYGLGPDFAAFVKAYLRTMPLKEATTVDRSFLERLHEGGQGITDTTVKMIDGAAKASILDGTERITVKHLEAASAFLPPPMIEERTVSQHGRREKRKS